MNYLFPRLSNNALVFVSCQKKKHLSLIDLSDYDTCSSEYKSFAYLYNEEQFMAALAKDVNIIKTLPKNLKEARRKKAVPLYRVPSSATPHFYLHQVLPMLRKHSVVELVVSEGGCLQVIADSFLPLLSHYPAYYHLKFPFNATVIFLLLVSESLCVHLYLSSNAQVPF